MAKKKSAPRAKAGAVRSQVRSLRGYGWVPDLPDQRDRMYRAPARMAGALPRSVDLRPGCPLVYDQGQLGSCTANAIAAALQFDQIKQGASDVFAPSRLFIYYNERVTENTVDEDAGAMIRDVIKSVRKAGAAPETLCPYDTSKFENKPIPAAYKDAAKHRGMLYKRLD